MHWHSPENSFSNAVISFSMLSKQNSLASSEEHRFLAVLSQFLNLSQMSTFFGPGMSRL
uniref:Uncharacterized protein n=1 Tax=Arundo donax TaxID=35708 RepID=A0A0A9HA62_ARUDO